MLAEVGFWFFCFEHIHNSFSNFQTSRQFTEFGVSNRPHHRQVPTIAIEKVHFYLNTSVFQEEFLAHRLGLIPIKAEAKQFEYPENGKDTFTD